MARALTAQGSTAGVCYRWRLFRGRRDGLADVVAAAGTDRPAAMLVGRFIPRHWVLVVNADVAAAREARLTGLGYPRPFAFVVPRSNV